MRGREEIPALNISVEMFDKIESASHLVLPRGYLSISQVNMYLRCAKQYEFRYVHNEKDPPSAPMIAGTCGHNALELTHHHIVNEGVPAETEEVAARFSDLWEEKKSDVVNWKDADAGKIKDVGIHLVKLYNEQEAPGVHPQVDKDGKRGIEKRFDITVAGVPMMGFIDLIEDRVSILSDAERELFERKGVRVDLGTHPAVIDFKFKSKSMSQSDADSALQLTLYSLATQIPSVRFDQLISTKKPKIRKMVSVRSRADHLWLAEITKEVAKAITAGVFPPCEPSSWICSKKWCGYWDKCRGRKV